MHNSFLLALKKSAALLALALIGACTPSHDWREVRGSEAPFTVLLPAKPTTLARPINLDGIPVTMTMTAAEVGGVTYAVGSVTLADAAQAKVALMAMKTAMIKNINGTVQRENASESVTRRDGVATSRSSIDLEARGVPAGGQPRRLVARFIAHDQRAYQAIVTGPEKALSQEQVDTFMTSFKVE